MLYMGICKGKTADPYGWSHCVFIRQSSSVSIKNHPWAVQDSESISFRRQAGTALPMIIINSALRHLPLEVIGPSVLPPRNEAYTVRLPKTLL